MGERAADEAPASGIPTTHMLRQRVISSLILLPVLAVSVWFGSPWFSLLVGVAVFLGLKEFFGLARQGQGQPVSFYGFLCALLIIFQFDRGNDRSLSLLAGLLMASLVWMVFQRITSSNRPESSLINWAWTLGGILYLAIPLGFWVILRNDFGREWTLVALLTTFAVDTGAYFTGRRWGKHKLAPSISPGKTREGAIGGLVCAIAAAVLLTQVFDLIGTESAHEKLEMPIALWQVILMGGLIGALSQLGDLAESKFKRSVGAKDASSLIPGHGGLLDRLDSLVVTGILVYSYLRWIA